MPRFNAEPRVPIFGEVATGIDKLGALAAPSRIRKRAFGTVSTRFESREGSGSWSNPRVARRAHHVAHVFLASRVAIVCVETPGSGFVCLSHSISRAGDGDAWVASVSGEFCHCDLLLWQGLIR